MNDFFPHLEILPAPQRTLWNDKALSYFDYGDLRQLSQDLKLRLATAAREVDLDHLPGIDKLE